MPAPPCDATGGLGGGGGFGGSGGGGLGGAFGGHVTVMLFISLAPCVAPPVAPEKIIAKGEGRFTPLADKSTALKPGTIKPPMRHVK